MSMSICTAGAVAALEASTKRLQRVSPPRFAAGGAAAAARYYAGRLGQEEQVLLEHPDRGHTEYFAPLRLLGAAGQPGEIRRLRVIGADAEGLVAEAA